MGEKTYMTVKVTFEYDYDTTEYDPYTDSFLEDPIWDILAYLQTHLDQRKVSYDCEDASLRISHANILWEESGVPGEREFPNTYFERYLMEEDYRAKKGG